MNFFKIKAGKIKIWLRNPYVIGVGMTKFGNVLETPEIKDKTLQELLAEAAFEAYDDAGISPEEIDAFLVR